MPWSYLIILLLWLPCGIASYFMMRSCVHRLGERWTYFDRVSMCFWGLLLGPGWLLTALILWVFLILASWDWMNKDAPW